MKIISRKEAMAKGLKHYFNGNPCKHGHTSKRITATCFCVQCAKERLLRINPPKGVKARYHPFCKIFNAAIRCKERKQFRLLHPEMYMAASKRGLLPLLTNHMAAPMTRDKWSAGKIMESAFQFSNISKWCKSYPGAYDAALRLGILSNATDHMERHLSSYDVVYIWGENLGNNWLCKVGVTSERLGMERIESVSQKSGVVCEFSIIAKSSCALIAEKFLKKLGEDSLLNGFNGSTEFRILNNSELTMASEIIYEYADGTTHPRMV